MAATNRTKKRMLTSVLKSLKNGVLAVWALTGTLPYLRLIILLALIVVAVIVYFNWDSAPSKTETAIKETTGEIIEQKAETTVATENVEAKEAEVKVRKKQVQATREVANKKVKEAEEIRNADQRGVNYEDANSARCQAYPGSKECQR